MISKEEKLRFAEKREASVMKLPGEEEMGTGGGGIGPSVIYMVIGVSAFILIVLFAVFRGNDQKHGGGEHVQEVQEQKEEEAQAQELTAAEEGTDAEAEEADERPKLRAEDLDFWDMYPEEEETDPQENAADVTGTETAKNPYT